MPEPRPFLRADGRRIDEAMKAVRLRGVMSRAETRELLVAELKARGLMLPPPSVEALLEDAVQAPSLGGRVERKVRGFMGAAEFASAASRLLKTAKEQQRGPTHFTVGRIRHIYSTPERRPSEVILDRGAQELLPLCAHDQVFVWLSINVSADHYPSDTEGTPGSPSDDLSDAVGVFLGDHRIGVLRQEAGEVLRPIVDESRDSGAILVVPAARSQDADGRWRLVIGLPPNQRQS
jgi:hypothetical protein